MNWPKDDLSQRKRYLYRICLFLYIDIETKQCINLKLRKFNNTVTKRKLLIFPLKRIEIT